MGSPVWTTISIGGVLPLDVDAGERIADAYADDMYEPDTDDVSGAVAEAIEAGKPLNLAGMCNYGQPDTLAKLCQVFGLTYSIHFEGGSGEWSAGCAYWQPGMGGEDHCDANSDGDPIFPARFIRDALADGTLDAALARAERTAGQHLPPLTRYGAVSASPAEAPASIHDAARSLLIEIDAMGLDRLHPAAVMAEGVRAALGLADG